MYSVYLMHDMPASNYSEGHVVSASLYLGEFTYEDAQRYSLEVPSEDRWGYDFWISIVRDNNPTE